VIGLALEETISLIKMETRLSRGRARGRRKVGGRMHLILDLSDRAKRYAEKMEDLARVRDGGRPKRRLFKRVNIGRGSIVRRRIHHIEGADFGHVHLAHLNRPVRFCFRFDASMTLTTASTLPKRGRRR
jgi:hypothetical protein